MDKVILGRLASFNLSMQQKKDLIEVIKYVAKYGVEYDNEEEIFDKLLEEGIEPVDFESEDGVITISVNPTDENKLKDVIEKVIPNVDYLYDEVGMFAKDKVTLEGEDKEKFELLLNMLNDVEDVSNIYHNVEL